MTEEKEKDLGNETAGLVETDSEKVSLFDKLKKYMMPAAIAVGASVISIVVFSLVTGGGSDKGKQAAEESKPRTEIVEATPEKTQDSEGSNNTIATNKDASEEEFSQEQLDSVTLSQIKKVDLSKYNIDTTKIMEDLNFLFTTPEDELAKELGLTSQDSVDTLNWFEAERAKLDKKGKEIDKRQKALEKLDFKVEQGLIKIGQAESSRIVKLARLYDGMKPNEVAKLFANLSDEVILSILPRMKPASASKILALIPSKRAARISTQMITILEDN